MKRVLLGLGSNKSFQGMSSEVILKMVCFDLASFFKNPVYSSLYRTRAMYVKDQQDFYNMVVLGFVSDDLSPFQLLEKIHQIEAKYGRNRSEEIRFGPRSVDIDIELFDDLVINTDVLQIPHPRIKERAFVLIPALEVLKNSADVKNDLEYVDKFKEIEKSNKINTEIKMYEEYLALLDLTSDENRVEKICSKEKLFSRQVESKND
ncbi:MAG: 2-amino-4-hydroxy-6-hydroxymethyldihydropteridine diphosphokinase [Treponema sp.]|nr:2-amino-4-hydroxy-6-hydroxymethyldihydropteridine diphosphokinase [Treponema sp.]